VAINTRFAGVIVILLTMVVMALQAVTMKSVSNLIPIWQITVLRSVFILGALLLGQLIYKKAKSKSDNKHTKGRRRNIGWLISRSLLMVSMNFLYYGSLPLLDLSTAAAAYYISPLITFLLAVIFLKEKINVVSILAVILGFYGALRVVNPASDMFSVLVLFPMLSALAYSMASIITRSRCQEYTAIELSFGVHTAFLLAGSIASFVVFFMQEALQQQSFGYSFITSQWVAMTPNLWGVVVLLALFNLGTHLGFAKSYQMAPASIVAPLEYSYLVFVAVFAFFMFSEIPSAATLSGMLLIVFSGILLVFNKSITTKLSRP